MLIATLCAFASLAGCRRGRAFWHRRAPATHALPRLPPALVDRGRIVYARYCALCHRADASGYAADHANAIGNADFLEVATDAFLRAAIADGRPGTPMSAWSQSRGGPLDDASIEALVIYLRSLSRRRVRDVGSRRIAGSYDAGRAVWNERCQSCHGVRGEGSATATSLSHPNFQRTASNGFIRYTVEHGRRGTPMVSFRALGPQALDDVVTYIRTLEHMPTPPPSPVFEPPPGLDQLVLNPSGRAPTFTLREDRYVPAADVVAALGQHRRMVILDARATSDWSMNHVAGALPFPFYNIEEMAQRLPHDGTWILAYCACPHAASGHVVDELRRRHFEHTAVIDEGIAFWTSHGYPTARAALLSGTMPPERVMAPGVVAGK
jgi:mono/diheme cytochrome c family protein/rhodanese-related sulfurtransferase